LTPFFRLRGYETTASYADSFGYPNANATINSSPTELSSLSLTSYAFATSVTNSLSQTVYSQFDYYTGMPVDAQDVNGIVTSGESEGDALDRPTQVIRAAGQSVKSQTTFTYDDTNRKVTTTSDLATYNDNALKTESYYDGLGRTTETRRYEGSTNYIKTTQTYDPLGRIKRAYNPFRTTSDATYGYAESTYDALGRVTNVATSDGSDVTTSYSGNTVTVTDQAGKQRKSVTDALGRLKTVYEPDTYGTLNVNTDYSYDVLNNLRTVSQGSQTRTFVYDNLSRLTAATNPESGTIDYTYDANGNLSTKLDDRNITTSYTYDALNRVTNRNYDDATPDVTYTYDNVTNAIGRLTKVSNSISETYYTAFDKMGRVTAHKQRMNSTDYTTFYTYNLAGALLEETYPSGRVVKNTIGSYGDLTQVETKPLGGSYTTRASNFVYSAPGAVSSMQLGNSKYETTEFNSRLQPTQIGLGTSTSDTSLLKIEYGYGTSTTNNGNVTTQKITVPGVTYAFEQSYTYDNLNRIATAAETYNGSQTWTQTFGYDRYGNRNITAGTGATSLTFSSSTNRITTSGYTFDAVGNTTADPSGKTLAYDAENKMLSATNGTTLGNYSYDGDGRRVKKYNTSTGDDTIFIYDAAGKLVEERDPASCSPQCALQTSYIYAGSRLLSTEIAATGATNYLTADMLGSPRINTNASGNVTARHDYLPFGEEIFSSLTPQRTSGVGYTTDTIRQQFTGYERDGESGLDFAQARYYNSKVGRFTTTDPIFFQTMMAIDPQRFNLYGYGRNNPLKWVDPEGERVYLLGDTAWLKSNVLYQMTGGQDKFDEYFEVKDGQVSLRDGVDLSKGNSGIQLLGELVNSTDNFIYFAGSDGRTAAALFEGSFTTNRKGEPKPTNVGKERIKRFEGTISNERNLEGTLTGTRGRGSGALHPVALANGDAVFFTLAYNPNAEQIQGSVSKDFIIEVEAQQSGVGQAVLPVSLFIHESAENLSFAQQNGKFDYRVAHSTAIHREATIRRDLKITGGFAGGGEIRTNVPNHH